MKLKLMILDRNIKTSESNNNDSWEKISNKLEEEYLEVQEAIREDYDKLHVAEELIDIIQVAIRGLVLLAKEGFDISKLFSRHNKKLVNRGWKEKKIINIFIKEWFRYVKSRRG